MALIIETTDVHTKAICADCKAWAKPHQFGGRIKHSRHCEQSHLQPNWHADEPALVSASAKSPTQIAKLAREGQIATVANDDEILELVRRNIITVSDAMNRDF